MSDTTALLLSSSVSFFMGAAIGFFGKRSLTADFLLMGGSGLTIAFGYLLMFGFWSDPLETEKLLVSLCMFAPGFVFYFLLPHIPGYMLGIFFKDKIQSRN